MTTTGKDYWTMVRDGTFHKMQAEIVMKLYEYMLNCMGNEDTDFTQGFWLEGDQYSKLFNIFLSDIHWTMADVWAEWKKRNNDKEIS